MHGCPRQAKKVELDHQAARLAACGAERRLPVHGMMAEIGSGLNGHRRKLISALRDPDVHAVVVEHRDRSARFGSESIEIALAAQGRRLLFVDEAEMKDDRVQDMIEVLTSDPVLPPT